MFHYSDQYSKEELEKLIELLVSNDNSNVILAVELIRNQGFHQDLERPLALIHHIRPDFWDERTQSAVQKLYKSRIESTRRGALQKELLLIKNYQEYNFGELTVPAIQNQIDDLEEFYTQYLNQRSHLLIIFRWIGRALSRNDYNKLAEEIYLKAIAWGTKDEDTFFNLALLCQNELDELELAAFYYTKALEIDPKDFVAHNNIGQIYESLKKNKLAEEHLQEALLIQPDYIHSIINLAYIRWKHQDRYTEAIHLYQQALQQDPYETYALCNYSALLIEHYEEAESLEKAEKMLLTSLDIDEEDDYAWKQLGKLMLKKNPVPNEVVVDCFEKAHYYNPKDKETLNYLNKMQTDGEL